MATKKPTTKAHRGFIHIRKDPGIGGRPRRRRPIGDPPPRGRRRPPRDPFNPFRPRIPRDPFNPFRPRIPRTDPRGVPIGIRRPTVEPQPIRRKKDRRFFDRPTVPDRLPPLRRRPPMSPEEKALLKRQLDEVARRRGIRRNRRTPQITAGLGSLGSSIFNRATRAQRRAKGGMIFKSKDYVNPSNTVDNKKK